MGGLALPNPALIKIKNILNRLKNLDSTPQIPWKALYIFWLGFGMRNIHDIYTDNKLVKRIDTPAPYRGIKEILYKYRDNKKLWELEKQNTYDWLCENNLGPLKIQLQYPYVNWARVWRHWSDIVSPKVQSIIYTYLHNSWLTGEVAFKRHLRRTLVSCPLCRKAPYTKDHTITRCDGTKEERIKLIIEIMKVDKYDRRQLLFLDGNFNLKKKQFDKFDK